MCDSVAGFGQCRVRDVRRGRIHEPDHLSALDRNRTYDLRFRKPTLYPLSYEGLRARLSARGLMLWRHAPQSGERQQQWNGHG